MENDVAFATFEIVPNFFMRILALALPIALIPRRSGDESEQETGSPNAPGTIDDFRLWGSRRCRKTNSPPEKPRWRVLSTTTTLFSQSAEPSPLWLRTFCERPIGRGITRIFRPQCDKGKRGCASRVPLPSGGTARSTRGVLVEGATHLFCCWCITGMA